MKAWVVAAVLAFAPAAWAQQRQQVYNPEPPPALGPFSLGMSLADARAGLPGAEWTVYEDAEHQRASMRTREAVAELYGVRFHAQLAFTGDAATLVHFSNELQLSQDGCRDQHRAMVEEWMRTRAPFTQRANWHFFFQDPFGPRGHVEGDTFVSATNTAARGAAQTIHLEGVQYDSVILVHDGSHYGQMYYSASGAHGRITAHSITTGGANLCRINVSMTRRSTGGTSPSGERLTELLAAATLVRPPIYVDQPSPYDVQRFYPPRALSEDVQGMAQLSCLVLADGALACVVLREEPVDYAFGEAGLRIVRGYRVDTFAIAPGNRVNIIPRFVLPD